MIGLPGRGAEPPTDEYSFAVFVVFVVHAVPACAATQCGVRRNRNHRGGYFAGTASGLPFSTT
jgi:hypothetical protein